MTDKYGNTESVDFSIRMDNGLGATVAGTTEPSATIKVAERGEARTLNVERQNRLAAANVTYYTKGELTDLVSDVDQYDAIQIQRYAIGLSSALDSAKA